MPFLPDSEEYRQHMAQWQQRQEEIKSASANFDKDVCKFCTLRSCPMFRHHGEAKAVFCDEFEKAYDKWQRVTNLAISQYGALNTRITTEKVPADLLHIFNHQSN